LDAIPLVITCRTTEYRALAVDRVLARAAVVEVLPVDAATAAIYLTCSGTADTQRWDPVIAALRASPPSGCTEALRSPLMLSLARTVWEAPSSDPAELTTLATAAELESRLLDGLIPSVYSHDPTDTTSEEARRWLTFFADNLPALGTGAIAWWRLPLTVPRWRIRILAGLVYALTGGLTAALITGLLFELVGSPLYPGGSAHGNGLVTGSAYGLAFGLLCGAVGVLTGPAPPAPSRWRVSRVRDLGHELVAGLKTGIGAGLGLGMALGMALGVTDVWTVGNLAGSGFWYGLPIALFVWVAAGITAIFSRRQLGAVTPVAAFRTDVRAGLIAGLASGLGSMLLALTVDLLETLTGAGATLADFPKDVLLYGVPIALAGFCWFAPQRCSAWPYGFAVAILVRRHAVPARPLRFLEDAYQRGVLRRAGMTYEFRHARLADRLRSTSQQ
jgi:hypothetical protein